MALLLATAGCQRPQDANSVVRPDFNPPPLDAYALSGGKIKHFIPMPGLPNSPTDKAMLKVCRNLKINSDTAHSGIALFDSREGKLPIPVLVVGNQTIISVGAVIRGLMIPDQVAADGTEKLFSESASSITLRKGSQKVIVGKRVICLQTPILWADQQSFMTFSDFVLVFQERDSQRGTGHEVIFDKIIYNPQNYQR